MDFCEMLYLGVLLTFINKLNFLLEYVEFYILHYVLHVFLHIYQAQIFKYLFEQIMFSMNVMQYECPKNMNYQEFTWTMFRLQNEYSIQFI
jgi:hypothetical protein